MATRKKSPSVAELKAKVAEFIGGSAPVASVSVLPTATAQRTSAYEQAMEAKRNGTLGRKVMTEQGWVCPD